MRKLVFALMSLWAFSAFADTTDDYVTLSQTELAPGGDAVMVIASLERVEDNRYTGFQIDLQIPEYLDPVLSKYKVGRTEKEDYCLKLTGDDPEVGLCETSHTVSSNLLYIDGKKTLRIACIATDGTDIYGESGPLLKFLLKASAYAKPGATDIKITNTRFGNGVSQYIFKERYDTSVGITTGTSLPLNINSSVKWNTCILPFATEIPDGVKAYTSNGNDENNVYLYEATSLSAYTPYILYSEAGHSGTLSGTVDPALYPENGVVVQGNLHGAIVVQEVSSGYVLQNGSEGVKFYTIPMDMTIPAGKCWVTLPSGSSSKAINFVFEDADGIDNVKTMSDNAEIYTLDGRKAGKLVPGSLYIKESRKFINK